MRLIDADALIEKRLHAGQFHPDMYVIGQGYVMDAPTVEKRGEWIETTMYATKTRYVCSVCGRPILANSENPQIKFPFCHCGADMRKNT